MKKFISFALIAAMAVTTLVGCGNKGGNAAGGSSDAAITVMSREDGSGTRGAFIELFGIEEEENGEKVDKTTDEASITNSTSVMMSSVANDANAIGYISLGSLNDTVKAVKIDGAEASVDNVKNGSYKVVRPVSYTHLILANCRLRIVRKKKQIIHPRCGLGAYLRCG